MRLLYTVLLSLALPIMAIKLLLPGSRRRGYGDRWRERFGFFKPLGQGKSSIWVHAVSMGEVNTAEPLIRALMARFPDVPIVVTTGSPTGAARVKQLFASSVHHLYLPVDWPGATRRFLHRVNPAVAIMMETEIWPNLFFACKQRAIPLMIANARLTSRSLKARSPLLRGFAHKVMQCVSCVAAQSEMDSARFRLLGVPGKRIHVTGNLKYDKPVSAEKREQGQTMRASWQRPVWIAASTHEGEEIQVLEAHRQVLQSFPDALLLLAPRHRERFETVAKEIESAGLVCALRSRDSEPTSQVSCFLIDTMGELITFYAASDVAFVGGSLAPVGGHNVLEPAALGCAVLVGPHTDHFKDVTRLLLSRKGALQVETSAGLADRVCTLWRDESERQYIAAQAAAVVEQKRGVTNRTIALFEPIISLTRI